MLPPDNPIHFEDGKWWFWDETWADRHGPFESEAAAEAALRAYVVEYLEAPGPLNQGDTAS